MALKYTLDSLDGIDEALHPLYTESGGKFVLAVEGAVPKERLDEFRTNNVNLAKERDALAERFKDIDPDKFRELSEKDAKIREKKLLDSGKVDEIVAERVSALKADSQKQLDALMNDKTSLTRQLEGLVVDGAIRDAASKVGVRSTAVEDVLLRGRAVFKLNDGKAAAMDGDKLIYGKNSEPMGIDEWVGGLAERAPHLFEASTGGGAPPPKTGGATGVAGKTMNRAQFNALDAAGQRAAVKDFKIVD